MTFSTDEQVRNALGNLRDRLPAYVVLEEYREIAEPLVLERLSTAYPTKVPTFEGPAAKIVALAESRIAAALILEGLRVNLPDLGEAPDQLRADAYALLDGGVVGYPAGSDTTVDDDGDPSTPSVPASTSPRVSSFTPLSAFPDPYEGARYGERFE